MRPITTIAAMCLLTPLVLLAMCALALVYGVHEIIDWAGELSA